MSTSLSSEELPEKLDKLEISRTVPQVKLMDSDLPLAQNPFYVDGSSGGSEFQLQQSAAFAAAIQMPPLIISDTTTTPTSTAAASAQECHTVARPQTCRRCRFRRRSESVLDDYKASVASAADTSEATRSTPGVQKQPLKKTSASGSVNRKVLIREPILRALQSCFLSHNVRRRLTMPTETNGIAGRPEAPTIVNEKSLVATAPGHSNDPSLSSSSSTAAANRGISDFRDLIGECQILLEQDVDFSGRLNQLSLSHRNSKNFTTMQQMPSTSAAAAAAIKCRKQQQQGRVSAKDSNGLLLSPPPPPPPPTNSITARSSSSPSPEHNASARATSSTSCSQQAGNSATSSTAAAVAATNPDDVNIDELASYFDTFVHIPKKMSSMAEMMYI